MAQVRGKHLAAVHTLPVPQYVAWAREQCIAIGVGTSASSVSRVSQHTSASPVRWLSPSVWREEICKRWVMRVCRRVVVCMQSHLSGRGEEVPPHPGENPMMVYVGAEVSHTVGVVKLSCEFFPRTVHVLGFVGMRNVVATGIGGDSENCAVRDVVSGLALCQLSGAAWEYSKFACGGGWTVVHDIHNLLLWPSSELPEVHSVKFNFWPATALDVCAIEGDNAILLAETGDTDYRGLLWCVNLRKSFAAHRLVCESEFSIDPEACGLDYNLSGPLFLTPRHGEILVVRSGFLVYPKLLTVNMAKHLISRERHKYKAMLAGIQAVDLHHFVDPDTTNGVLDLYSTDDLERPCRIFTWNPGSASIVGSGFLAFLQAPPSLDEKAEDKGEEGKGGHIDLCDAVTGKWVLTPLQNKNVDASHLPVSENHEVVAAVIFFKTRNTIALLYSVKSLPSSCLLSSSFMPVCAANRFSE
ncbi:hypothetical protein Pelo_3658 [Pelomyxa schiedti]|nr:hypothetical protein Pelo_3658 [Pelomyxa schiedti]